MTTSQASAPGVTANFGGMALFSLIFPVVQRVFIFAVYAVLVAVQSTVCDRLAISADSAPVFPKSPRP
jgi:hypothetical protein